MKSIQKYVSRERNVRNIPRHFIVSKFLISSRKMSQKQVDQNNFILFSSASLGSNIYNSPYHRNDQNVCRSQISSWRKQSPQQWWWGRWRGCPRWRQTRSVWAGSAHWARGARGRADDGWGAGARSDSPAHWTVPCRPCNNDHKDKTSSSSLKCQALPLK